VLENKFRNWSTRIKINFEKLDTVSTTQFELTDDSTTSQPKWQ